MSRAGRPADSVDPAGPESSDVFVILKPRKSWRHGMTPEALAADLGKRLEHRVPATNAAFSQPIEMRVNDLIAGVKGDVAIEVYGQDLTTMSAAADAIVQRIAPIAGATDVKRQPVTGLPSITVTVDRERAGRVGVTPEAILDVMSMARAGLPVGVVREGERVFPLVLRIGGETVDSSGALARLPVATAEGKLVPLGIVSAVTSSDTLFQVSREQMRRRVVVQANVRGRDLVGFVVEAKQAVAELELPRDVTLEWGGQFQNFDRAKQRLTLLVPVALAVIGLMLVIAFGRWSLAALALCNLPFALAGGAFGLFARGLPFSIPAGVGFIALSGISVITALVVVQAFLDEHGAGPPEKLVFDASLAALRAPVSTALVAAVGFIPAALATGTGAEVQRPLATVVIFGLMTSMVLSLLCLPAMLLLWSRHGRRGQREVLEREPGPTRD